MRMHLRGFAMLLLITLLMAPTLLIAAPLTASAQDEEDAQLFQTYLSQVDGSAPVVGPVDGELSLVGPPENVESLDVELADLLIHIDFQVPVVDDGEVWAAAVAFRETDDQFHYFVLWSDGGWSFAPAGGGGVTSGDGVTIGAPGELVHLHVVAVGAEGYIGIGTEYLTTLDLSSNLEPGNVTVTANLVGTATAEDDPLFFTDLAVWSLTGETPSNLVPTAPAEPTTAPAVVLTPDASPDPTTSQTDQQTFDAYLQQAISLPIIYGPVNDVITHDPETVAIYPTNTSVSDFVARVECLSARPASEGFWDCGIVFRNAGAGDSYRLVYVSDGYWFLSIGSGEPLVSGTDGPVSSSAEAKVVLNLVVVGSDGYFGFNDEFVARLDLSQIPGPGSVDLASAFFNDTSIDGGGTEFEDFIIWSLDDPSAAASPTTATSPVALTPTTSAAEPTQTPVTSASPVAETPTAATSSISGTTYTSPTFGYSLSWNDSWVVDSENSDERGDYLGLSNGPITADLIGEFWEPSGGTCFDRLIQYYEGEPSYSNIQSATDSESAVPGTWDITGILTMTFTDEEDGSVTDYVNYVACSQLPGLDAIVSLEQFVPVSDFRAQLATMDELRGAFVLEAGAVIAAETPTEVAPSEPTATPTSAAVVPVVTPTESAGAQTPTETAGAQTSVSGNTYTSPTFGYQLTWDDAWSVDTEQSSEGVDFLRIATDTLVADLYAAAGSNTAMQCIDDLFAYYQNDPLYTNVEYVPDADGQPLIDDQGDYATALIAFTSTDDSGVATDSFSYATCFRLEEQGAIAVLEIYMAPSDFVLQTEAITALQNGLILPGQSGPQSPVAEVLTPPAAEITPEAATTPATGTEVPEPPEVEVAESATFLLAPVNNSGVQGTGTLEAQARLVTVTAIVLGAQPGDVVAIHRGSCDLLAPLTEPDYIVGELDESGLVRAEITVRLTALLGGEPYSVAVYAAGESFDQLLACGTIQG